MAVTCNSTDGTVRKRLVDSNKREEKHGDISDGCGEKYSKSGDRKETTVQSLQTGTYWLTRIVLLRSVAFIYCKYFIYNYFGIEIVMIVFKRELHYLESFRVGEIIVLYTVVF